MEGELDPDLGRGHVLDHLSCPARVHAVHLYRLCFLSLDSHGHLRLDNHTRQSQTAVVNVKQMRLTSTASAVPIVSVSVPVSIATHLNLSLFPTPRPIQA